MQQKFVPVNNSFIIDETEKICYIIINIDYKGIYFLRKTVIEPNGKNLQYWKDIWNYRELALNLAKRDIVVRYKQTRIGLGWAVIAPIISTIVSTFIFGSLAHLSSDGSAPYFIMVFAGNTAWSMFSRSLTNGSMTFLTNASIMKKVYFPRILSPIGAELAYLVDSLISMVMLIIMMLAVGYFPTVRMLLFPVFLILNLILGLAFGLFLSAFNIKFRDLAQIIPFAVSIWQYLSPVVYSLDSIPEKYRLIYSLNPAAGFINAFKWCIIGDMKFDWLSFWVAVAWMIVFIPCSIAAFRKSERTFVDLV